MMEYDSFKKRETSSELPINKSQQQSSYLSFFHV